MTARLNIAILLLVLASAATAHGGRLWGNNFLLYSANAEDYARVEFTTGNYIIRCADNISKGLATRFYGESAAMSSSMRYKLDLLPQLWR
ncbi:uncharacterized protein ACA1_247700 [Acanthamoeba castellanii str. Neff]|uniref:Uncharacterized protein n=1 Tax=Acanthamoeba castellanii (strain ATCC 30010 / Neff) TaxID=1257118 RepID=L8GKJ2_ACACF|nr:uncharacterized protein ACA1_247700 [Acanthamoeba castellanii str. Neff]ELR13542.1 hypothetical protein ACA1_247700 [Acanthamoeba castellanii str. Neff]